MISTWSISSWRTLSINVYHKLHNTKQNKISDQKKTRLKHSSQRKLFAGAETNRSKLGWKGKHTRKQINSENNQPHILYEKRPRAIRLSQRKRNFWNYLHDKQKQDVNKKKRYKVLQGITHPLNMEFVRLHPTNTRLLSIHFYASLRFFTCVFLRWAISWRSEKHGERS